MTNQEAHPTSGNGKTAPAESISELRARLAGVFARLLSVTAAARQLPGRAMVTTPERQRAEAAALQANQNDAMREAILALLEGQAATLAILERLVGGSHA